MPQYAIMRMEKLKSRRAILGAVEHNSREHMPANADPSRSRDNFFEGSSQAVMERYTALLPAKVRKDAVHAIEIVATASPDWFAGKGTDAQMAFYESTIAWASRFFGPENVISTAVHLDEKTPHVHLIAMPLVKGKLNAKALIGGSKYRMRELQDDFFKKVGKPLGMERGVVLEDSKRHTKPREIGRIIKELEAERSALLADREALKTEWAELNQAKKEMFTDTMKGALGAKFQEYGLATMDGIADYWRAFGETLRNLQASRKKGKNQTMNHTAEPKRTR